MLVNDGGTATQPRAPGHERLFAALRAAKHGRLSAASTAPGADVPPATTAGAPGQYCLRAAHLAPGHERPRAALRAPRHGRPSAATRAPGADVPPAIPAGAPGQYRLRAAHLAPGHERPRAALCATRHGRPSAATRAPGADVPPAAMAGAPGQHRLRAMAIATVALPAGQHRLRQEDLPRVPANPRTPTYSPSHLNTAHARMTSVQALPSPNPAGSHRAASPAPRDSGPFLQGGGLGVGPSRPPAPRGDRRGASPNPAPAPLPVTTRPPLPCQGRGRGLGLHFTKCILPSKYRPARGLAPPRVRASPITTPPAPHPSPPAENLPVPALSPLSTWWRGAGGEACAPPPLTECLPAVYCQAERGGHVS